MRRRWPWYLPALDCWTCHAALDGNQRTIGTADILGVTPYNAQVNLLTRMLPAGARIGTVDKFQGQEAPVCLISVEQMRLVNALAAVKDYESRSSGLVG